MESSFRIIRVRGIEIGANWSYLLIFGLITYSLATVQFPFDAPGLATGVYWAMGVSASLLFVISLVLHELGHAFRAQREGMTIEGITLWMFGGVAKFKGMFPSAGAEFRIAIAGPIVSMVLAVIFEGGARLGDSAVLPVEIVAVLRWLGFINVVLLAFNMLPGLPLDGGRVLRAYLWQRKGNFAAATVSAARVSRVIAGVIIAIGGLTVFLTGNLGGVWPMLIGFFLMQAAQGEVSYALMRQTLSGRTVGDLMLPVRDLQLPEGFDEPRVHVDDDVGVAIQTMQEGGTGRAIVLDDDERIVGLLTMMDIGRALELARSGADEEPGQKRGGWLLPVGIGVFIVLLAGYLYAPPFVTFGPGEAFDVTADIEISGYDVDDVNGKYLLTSVSVQQPNTFGFLAAILQGQPLEALGEIVPPDVDPDEFFEQQERLFKERQRISAAAAARAAGLDVELTGSGARVIAVRDDAPADGSLQADDVVVAVNGRTVELADDLSSAIRSRPAGTRFEMDVERGDEELTVEVTSRGGILEEVPAIGVEIDTRDFDVDLPFEISFREREIGGPSAGLTYALAVYDLLEDSDTARGRSIATTGEMSIDGLVGAVGGIDQKAIGAEEGGADVFLVPESEVRLVGDTELDVIGVRTLEGAIEALA